MTRLVCMLALATVVVSACGDKKGSAIAELVKADGPVDRQASGKDAWAGAAVGTKFYLGDAARTADGGAQLTLAGAATIAMQPHTVLRFGGTEAAAKISVELGAIDLSGSGSYSLDLGRVTLAQGGSSIRITAGGPGAGTITLLAGTAEIQEGSGSVKLEPGVVFSPGKVTMVTGDAGVDAAPADAPPPTADNAQIEVTGKHAEIQGPGESKWSPLPAGAGTLEKGAKIRLGAATTAKLVGLDTTLELGAQSRLIVNADLVFGMELGSAKATVPANLAGKVGVPGGIVELKGTPTSPAVAKIDVGPHGDAKVTMMRGGGKLDGAPGTTLEMTLGETATVAKAGTIHPLEAIPTFFDFAAGVGESFTIHDPKGQTALKFKFEGKCGGGGVIEVDRPNSGFRTAKLSGGKDSANMMLAGGGWAYRLRCGDGEGPAVAQGHIGVVRDDGRRPLPPKPGKNPIDADGRNYTISYQSLIPIIEVHYRGGGSKFTLHLATAGADEPFDAPNGVVEIPGNKLKEATYTYWFDHDGVKQDKVSTLKITFDQTAPQVYIESPINGAPFGVEIDVRGAVLPGWTAKVDAFELPIDKNTRRFGPAKVPPPEGQALAIRLSHPQRGVHYYLRRGTK
jgi:hypothetical protein